MQLKFKMFKFYIFSYFINLIIQLIQFFGTLIMF